MKSEMESKDNAIAKNNEFEKKNNSKAKGVVSEVFSDYCSSTSIHGIGYLGADDKNWIEKIWWALVFVLSLTACTFLIRQTWIKWKENPVVVTFSTEQNPIWEVPFPAVTICPLNKVEQIIYDYSYEYDRRENLTGYAHKKFWDISLICKRQFIFTHNAHESTDEDVIKHIKEVAPKLQQTVTYVTFNDMLTPLKYFVTQITSEGVCFTFNSLGKSDMATDQMKPNVELIGHNIKSTGWTIEDGYPDDEDTAYPIRIAEEGVAAGLNIILSYARSNRDFVCGEPVTGFKVLLHNPAEAPRVSQQYILAPMNKEVIIAVNPKVITTSKGLLNIPPKTRNCYFSKEKKLSFFKIYTQNNCKLECIANVTKVMCGCLSFHSPRDNDTTICGYAKTNCVSGVKRLILRYENMIKKDKIDRKVKNINEFKTFAKCSCLPSCASLDYEYQTSAADFNIEQWINQSDAVPLYPNTMESIRLKIFFQDSQFLALHRAELYGQTDFLANIGGLLGLFMGFSFLSLIEIIYFVTLRIWCKLYYKRQVSDCS